MTRRRNNDKPSRGPQRPPRSERSGGDTTSPLQGDWEGDPKRDEEDVEREDGPLDPLPEEDADGDRARPVGTRSEGDRGRDRAEAVGTS